MDLFLQNGFSEEFLFRGALQTRLSQLLGDGWGLVLASLVFGIVHLGLNTKSLGGDYLAGLAASVVFQATSGLLFGLTFMRTRSLIAPTEVHIVRNMMF
ncbi:membrane protease YdiL (CAAX protease family) [Symbiobacterium terraclitae]|uniref:Membrane protease YdiL (CAAX protease family) n=1 Tax=Symbiobacterium terraclitae TaxID=557451 RepID=A0ABS4JQJ2_9FIRM|nr:CPBP family intramembrane glutamic endopeptidase [Symbiobacterium terraclitae]MBP2017814.1 membrane protease YdiL (CAAX protease family) [Symbiobacterium terraclitae]